MPYGGIDPNFWGGAWPASWGGGYDPYSAYYNQYIQQYYQSKMGEIKESYDTHVRDQQKKELDNIKELRNRIEKYTRKTKEKQVEAEEELKEQQMLNRQLMKTQNMVRENEFLRSKMNNRELDKLDRATDTMHAKTEDAMRLKEWVHNYPPGVVYPHNKAYSYPPLLEHTTVIDGGC